jgi:hypothetical protein
MTPAPDERQRIRAAMERILSDAPQNSNGALTIVALAQEAEVPRNALTQRHLDLEKEFHERVKERGTAPDAEARLRATIVKLKKTISSKNEERNRLRADLPALVRVINQLILEPELRAKLGMKPGRLHILVPSPLAPAPGTPPS